MYEKYIKRIIDVLLSTVLLILTSPFLLLAAIAMKIEHFREPILFRQLRCGKNAKPFTIYKLRSMSSSAPPNVATEALDSDAYISRLGRLLRITSIDEIPQLYNIWIGDMSFIGPRPVILQETELIELRKKLGVYTVKPGITGLAQINGRDQLGNEEKAALDSEYVRTISFRTDFAIFFRTIPAVLARRGIKEVEKNEHHE